MSPSAYNNNMQHFQTPGYVAILNEMAHDSCVIPLDGRSHPPPACASGWETHVAAGRGIRWSSARPISPARRTSEAPARTCTWSNASGAVDADTLLYEYTMPKLIAPGSRATGQRIGAGSTTAGIGFTSRIVICILRVKDY